MVWRMHDCLLGRLGMELGAAKATSVAALALFLMQMNATGYIYYFDTYAP